MEAIRSRPLFTEDYVDPAKFIPEPASAYIYGVLEERSGLVENLKAGAPDVLFVRMFEGPGNSATTDVQAFPELSLRSRDRLVSFFDFLEFTQIYIDITGLSHHVWAPLIRVAIETGRTVRVVYVEPAEYRYSNQPIRGEIFDLSEKISGISPIPLFVTLADPEKQNVCFVPLLGFEGTRFAFLLEEVDPPGGRIIPVIGIPGFRPEYPFYAYHGNERVLAETRSWKKMRFARANCPFSLFYVLSDILEDQPDDYIKIAPIGTKPHALGAVLKCIASSRQLELVYDHPKRKQRRTAGTLHCLVYHVSEFLRENPLNQSSMIA